MKKYNLDDNELLLGQYPQTVVRGEKLLNGLKKLNAKDGDVVVLYGYRYLYTKNNYYLFDDINWILLSVKGDEGIFISEKVLDIHSYSNSYITNFTNSEIAKWLNNEFYKVSGLDKEDLLIDEDNLCVSLLNKEQLEDYDLENINDKKVDCTDYALRDVSEFYASNYWSKTESPYEGRVYTSRSWEFIYDVLGVRPLIRLKISVPKKEYGPSYLKEANVNPPKIDGDNILFGLYPSSSITDPGLFTKLDELNPDEEGYVFYENNWYKKFEKGRCFCYFALEPISWRIVKEDEDSYLLLANKAIDALLYSPLYYRHEPKLMDYLNGDFIEHAFKNQKDYLKTFRDKKVNLLDVDDTSTDNQYIPDLIDFFQNDDERKLEATDYAYLVYDEYFFIKKRDPLNCSYWLDSKVEENDISYYTIGFDGQINTGYYYDVNFVRPMILIKK